MLKSTTLSQNRNYDYTFCLSTHTTAEQAGRIRASKHTYALGNNPPHTDYALNLTMLEKNPYGGHDKDCLLYFSKQELVALVKILNRILT